MLLALLVVVCRGIMAIAQIFVWAQIDMYPWLARHFQIQTFHQASLTAVEAGR